MSVKKKSKAPRAAAAASATAVRVASTKPKRRNPKNGRGRGLSATDAKWFEETYAPLVKEMVLEAIEDWMDIRDAEEAMKEPGERLSHEEVGRLLGL